MSAVPPEGAPSSRKRPFLARLAASAQVGVVGRRSPRAVSRMRWIGPVLRLCFRPRIEGWDRLPRDRPYLLVANHSGGGATEIAALGMLWLERFGADSKLTGLAHPLAFHIPLAKGAMRDLGAVPSTYEAALGALEQGVPVLVFPGGDHDAFRPIWQANTVDFNGRKGFLRIARRAWVPVVPLGIRGSVYTAPMLWRSRYVLPYLFVFPRLLGLKRFPLSVLGLVGAVLSITLLGPELGYPAAALVAWAWANNPLAILFPIVPWTISAQIGDPMEPEGLFGSQDAEGALDEAYERVVGAIQELVRPETADGPSS